MRSKKELLWASLACEEVLLDDPDNTIVKDQLAVIDWVLGVEEFPFHESVRRVWPKPLK